MNNDPFNSTLPPVTGAGTTESSGAAGGPGRADEGPAGVGGTAPASPSLSPAELELPAPPKGPTFASLGLKPHVLAALEEMGFKESMPVQAATLPLARQGKDLMVQSRTGSGKTAAFGIPFVNDVVDPEKKAVQALVLLPTRELALQVASEIGRIAARTPVSVVPVYGGAPMGRQVELLKAGGQIVCGTPGRVLDHLRRGTLKLDQVRCAVLDECDEMLSMGFQQDIESILERTPETRQTLLFSATVPEGIQRLSRRFLRNPEFLKLSGDHVGVNEIRHVYYSIPGVNREQELLRILNFEEPKTAIVFCNTREETGRVAEFLQRQGFEAEAISSDLSQSDREKVMTRMRAGKIRFLVATDVAARGIDIEALSHVFNYTFPEAPELYVHRTGRTGRAGKHGTAISLIGPTEVGSFYYLKLLYKIRPEERALPSEAEIRSHREGERILQLRGALGGEPGGEWRGLAKRLMSAIDGERLVASLLAKSFASLEGMPAAPPVARAAAPAVTSGIGPLESRGGRTTEPAVSAGSGGTRAREDAEPRTYGRDRGERRPDRGREGREGRDGRTRYDRGGESRDKRSDERERPPERGGTSARGSEPRRGGPDDEGARRASGGRLSGGRTTRPTPAPAESSGGAAPPEKEFWEVWSDEKAAREASSSSSNADDRPLDRAEGDRDAGERAPAREASRTPSRFSSGRRELGRRGEASGVTAGEDRAAAGSGAARLYLNLGRKDGAGDAQIRELILQHAGDVEIESLEVMNTHTYVNVPASDGDRVVVALAGKQLGDRDLVCERAKPRRF